MKIPDYPVPGEPIPATWGRQVVDFLRSLAPRPSPEVLPSWSPNGTTWRLLPWRRRLSAAVSVLPWAVTVSQAGAVKCAGGRFVARLAGATILSQDVAADDALGSAVDGHSVYLLYTHRGAGGTAPSVSLEYGELPDETAETLPIEIARTVADGGSWAVEQYEAAAVLVEDAHRGHIVLWDSSEAVPEFWEIVSGMAGRFPVGAGGAEYSYALQATGGYSRHGTSENDHGDHVNTTVDVQMESYTITVPQSGNDVHGDSDNRPPFYAVHFIRRT